MKLPDITPAQIAAIVTFVLGFGATLGLKVDGDISNGATSVAIASWAVIAAAWKLADSIIRGNRAKNAQSLMTLSVEQQKKV